MDQELETLAREVGAWLTARGARLATAESCTGGWIAETITAIPGSSGWFDRGWVTYSNAAKEEMLGVQAATLRTQGAVSQGVAAEMAIGAIIHSGADVAVSVSGIAGPEGGSAEKPVGTVCFGLAARSGGLATFSRHFEGDREAVRRQAVIAALRALIAGA